MKLRCFVLFLMGMVQVSSGQSFTGSNLRGSSAVTLDIKDFSILLVPEVGAGRGGSSSGETGVMNPAQSLFVGKGINGVYLEISIPTARLETAVMEERFPEQESED